MPTIHGGSAANEIPDNLAAAMNRRFANDITSDGDQAAAAAMEMFADGDGTVAPEGSDTSSASVYRVKIAGQEVDLTGDQIENMVALANWAASLDRNVAQQMYAVETGQAVTLPRDEYLRLQSLQEAAAQGGPGGGTPPEDLDDDARDYIERLRAENEQLRLLQQQPDPAAVAYYQQQELARRSSYESSYEEAAQAWQDSHGLQDDEMEQLVNFALSQNAFGTFAQADRVVAPDGRVLRDVNMGSVTEKALNFALASRPDLMERSAMRRTREIDGAAAVSRKKANAASLAAAPSAAIPQPTVDPRSMSSSQLVSEMANAIRKMEGA